MDAYIIDACRTPRGRRGGGLAGAHPIDLCTVPMHAVVARTGADPTRIDDALIGSVTDTAAPGACAGPARGPAAGWPIASAGARSTRFCGARRTTGHPGGGGA